MKRRLAPKDRSKGNDRQGNVDQIDVDEYGRVIGAEGNTVRQPDARTEQDQRNDQTVAIEIQQRVPVLSSDLVTRLQNRISQG